LPQSNFYVAKKISENKAMVQLQSEIYANRKVAALAKSIILEKAFYLPSL
jgi:hypothetical protein